ncbi:MAG TPA: glutaminase A [Dermatophilaceae bacterium]|nr:glutaminase A [Dermatophilaceae bacterium]
MTDGCGSDILAAVVDDWFVSSGRLPGKAALRRALGDAHEQFRHDGTGSVSNVYPALAQADPAAFGLCVADVAGDVVEVGESRVPFTLMSVAKPFVLALVCREVGMGAVRALVGVNATGLPFNAVEAVERSPRGRTNPMVNPGAIATTSLVPGASSSQRWAFILEGLGQFAGHALGVDQITLDSALGSNHRNRALANLLKSLNAVAGDPAEAVDLYTHQSCVSITAADLAVMAATLADGGVNPVTGHRVVDAETSHDVLGVMAIAGMYETSGDWLLDVGMPAKSGISGGIVSVSPGKGALATFSPLLDGTGNSVRGQLATQVLARRLGLDVLASQPAQAATGSPAASPTVAVRAPHSG